ncbi:hypothetical protein CVT26_002817 [Gymnopilus dilepis]|uniref:Uncharacterized protein n=1 Tax=Gymnopilus dilepis TaxID=231916 RepID=A0A409Y399_9AGAR|nr:hypothetical protein CVT26_002817 [Gymnopilus dilepis]
MPKTTLRTSVTSFLILRVLDKFKLRCHLLPVFCLCAQTGTSLLVFYYYTVDSETQSDLFACFCQAQERPNRGLRKPHLAHNAKAWTCLSVNGQSITKRCQGERHDLEDYRDKFALRDISLRNPRTYAESSRLAETFNFPDTGFIPSRSFSLANVQKIGVRRVGL